MLFRRFGYLQKRVLLYKQDELRELEGRLAKLDEDDAAAKAFGLCSRVSDNIKSPTRKQLIAEVESKLKEYGESLTLKTTKGHIKILFSSSY